MASKQPTPQPAELRQRSAAGRCHFLAAKLAESRDGDPVAVAVSLALESLGGEIKGISDKARALVARWEAAQLVHDDAAAFIEAEPDWILGVVALLREVARG